MSQHLHALPAPGGLFDQDSLWVEGINMVVEAQAAKQELDRLTAAKADQTQVPRGPLGAPQFR
jgi:hypothetical protein